MDKKHEADVDEVHDSMTEALENSADEAQETTSEASDSGDILAKLEALRDRLDVAEKQAKDYESKALYAMAELENIKRRSQLDVENAHKFGLEKFLTSIIPVIDSLDQALEVKGESDDTTAAMREGIEMTLRMFIETVGKAGVTRIDPIGEAFDPNLHEAMSMQENPDHAPDTIIAVYQRGYQLNGRLIRPARVVVSK